MTWNVRKLISPPFQCTSIIKRFLSLFDRFTTYLQVYDLKCQKTHISAISVHLYHKSCFSLISPFNGLSQHYDLKFSENSYLRHFSAQVSQIVFLAYLTVLRLITTVWPKMSENSYLRHFSAQVSQIVFLAYLPFYVLLQLYDLKCQKTHISVILVHKYHKSFS